jgi:hypothetical protein
MTIRSSLVLPEEFKMPLRIWQRARSGVRWPVPLCRISSWDHIAEFSPEGCIYGVWVNPRLGDGVCPSCGRTECTWWDKP